MKKIVRVFAIITIIACHTESPYAYDIAKILAMDARKIPEFLGMPYSEKLPDVKDLNEDGDIAGASYTYLKDKYTMSIYYYYKIGIIG